MGINTTVFHTWEAEIETKKSPVFLDTVQAQTIKKARKKFSKKHLGSHVRNIKRIS